MYSIDALICVTFLSSNNFNGMKEEKLLSSSNPNDFDIEKSVVVVSIIDSIDMIVMCETHNLTCWISNSSSI